MAEWPAALRQLRTALIAVADCADEGEHPGRGDVFRAHAATLDGIDHEITADLAADRAAAEGARASAAMSASPAAGAASGTARSGAGATPFASAPGRAADRGRR